MYETTERVWAVGEDQTLARLTLAEKVESYVRINMIWRRARPELKTIAQAHADGFRYNDESRQVCRKGDGCHNTEAPWMDWPSALDHGSADCKTFVAAEISELRLAGINAQVLMVCYKCEPVNFCPVCALTMVGAKQTWHVQTLRPDGTITDPSRWFGMRAHPDGDNAVIPVERQAGLVKVDANFDAIARAA